MTERGNLCVDPDDCVDGDVSETVCGTEKYYETTPEKKVEIICENGEWYENSRCKLEDNLFSEDYTSWGTLECVGDDAYLNGKKFSCELCWEISPEGTQCKYRTGNVGDPVYVCGELSCE
ncbi:MAG: hypothetical protein R6W70_00990 [bacterium]